MQLFRMTVRKDSSGKIVEWEKSDAFPRLEPASTSYFVNEDLKGSELLRHMAAAGLAPYTPEKEHNDEPGMA
jgi:hypothetical protein